MNRLTSTYAVTGYVSLAIELTHDEQANKVRSIIRRRLSRSLSNTDRLSHAVDEVCSDVWAVLLERLSSGVLVLSGYPDEDIPALRRYVLSLAGYAVAEYWRRVIGDECEPLESDPIDYRDDERPPRYQLLTASPEDLVSELDGKSLSVAFCLGWINPHASITELAELCCCSVATVKRRKADLRYALGQRMVAQVVCEALDSLIPDNSTDPLLAAVDALYDC